jgi:hypothetical protein
MSPALLLSALSIGGLRIPGASALLFFRGIIDLYSEVGPGTLSLPSHFLMSGTRRTPSALEEVLELLEELVALDLPNLHLCMASSPEFDIRRSLEPLEPLQISLHEESGQKNDRSHLSDLFNGPCVPHLFHHCVLPSTPHRLCLQSLIKAYHMHVTNPTYSID